MNLLFCDKVSHMGEDEYFNLMLHPHLQSMYLADVFVYAYRWGGITCRYNPYLAELFDFGDIRLKLLDKYEYRQGYQLLFIEYRNILNTELVQRIHMLGHSICKLIEYVENELDSRYLVGRMRNHYQHDNAPSVLVPILEHNVEAIVNNVFTMARSTRRRYQIKRILSHLI